MLKLTIIDRAADVRAPVSDGPGVYVWRDLRGRPCAYGHTVDGQHWMHWPNLASYRFDNSGDEVVAIPTDAARPDVILDTFHRMVLPIALQVRGLEALHASAILMNRGVVAFCASSGTGKSTLAYALSKHKGYRQWSDDAVVFEVSASAVTVAPLPFDVRLLPETATEFGGKAATIPHFAAVRYEGAQPAPLGAICILTRGDRQPLGGAVSVTPLTRAQALAAVLEHAHCFSLADRARKKLMLEHYLDVVERIPVFRVRFKPGLDKLDAVVDGVARALDT